MVKMTFTKNVKGIINQIENAESAVKITKQEGFELLSKAAFKQVNDKYVVRGKWAFPSKSGKTLTYKCPPGGDIKVKRRVRYDKGNRKWIKAMVPLYVMGRVVSRSGNYENTMDKLADSKFPIGTTEVNGIKVKIDENSVQVSMDDKSHAFLLEARKQQGRTKIMPVQKAFRSIVSLWKSVRIKLGK